MIYNYEICYSEEFAGFLKSKYNTTYADYCSMNEQQKKAVYYDYYGW